MDYKNKLHINICQRGWNRPMAVTFELPGWVLAKKHCFYGTNHRIIANR